MESFYTFQKEIHKLTASEQYADTLSYFKKNKTTFSKEEISGNQYLVADVLKCLRLTGAYEAAQKFMTIYSIILSDSTPERILNAWLLVLYDWYKSILTNNGGSKLNEENDKKANIQLQQAQDKIVRQLITLLPLLSKQTGEFAFDLYNLLVLKVLKSETKMTHINWRLINDFCISVDPMKLKTSTQEVTFNNKGREKTSELASVLETWYAQYSKSLFALGDYSACLKICQDAFANITKMHYSNEIWFSRRMAQCLKMQGDIASAITKFEKIIVRKSDWFMLAELADLHSQSGNKEKALLLMHQAMLQPGELSYKVELLEKLGDLYTGSENTQLKNNHYKLAIAIRQSAGWKVEPSLYKKGEMLNNTDVTLEEKNMLFRKLHGEWKSSVGIIEHNTVSSQKNDRLTGEIIFLSIPKEAGVDIRIKSTNGKQYYAFIERINPIYSKIKEGVTLSFEIKPLPDKKLDKAIKIRIQNQ
jgi:tetratricopeptide (TPR) repeat protein